MSTNSNIYFQNTNVMLYSHFDGYPEGMAAKLVDAYNIYFKMFSDLHKSLKINSQEYMYSKFINCFIMANSGNIDIISLDESLMREYEYTIYFKDQMYINVIDSNSSGEMIDNVRRYKMEDFINYYTPYEIKSKEIFYNDEKLGIVNETAIYRTIDALIDENLKILSHGDYESQKEIIDENKLEINRLENLLCP